jgi:hypothetical protein
VVKGNSDYCTMAEDIWTLHLEHEGAAPEQGHVTREMDRDEICYFSLMEFVWEYWIHINRLSILQEKRWFRCNTAGY